MDSNTRLEEAAREYADKVCAMPLTGAQREWSIKDFKAGAEWQAKELAGVKEQEIEPIPMKAGDIRVMVNGDPVRVDFRIISEELYQKLTRKPLV